LNAKLSISDTSVDVPPEKLAPTSDEVSASGGRARIRRNTALARPCSLAAGISTSTG
jgi:hypothetical protein